MPRGWRPICAARCAREAGAAVRKRLIKLGTRSFITLQRVLPHHGLSRAVHALARSRIVPLKRALIGAFMHGYRPELHDALEQDPRSYASFNDFFTRALRAGARPLAGGEHTLISPVDGTVAQVGYLDGLTMLQAKGRKYTLDALLAGRSEWTERLAGGAFATLYLAPYNYHRIHMPLAAELRAAWYVPGRLFSVSPATAETVSGLYARNERVVCLFEGKAPGGGVLPFALVLVGALLVGSMATVWHGDVTPRRPRRPVPLATASMRPQVPASLARGAEMGRFNMGSSVILVLGRDALTWRPGLRAGERIRVGQPLGALREHT
jgi:phosphatidylserine decarboxylase